MSDKFDVELKNEDDFKWYKLKLDVESKYTHRHYGIPDRYPCLVRSNWADNPNGPYEYLHDFLYKQEVVCAKCGSKTLVWPEPPDQC